MNSRGQIFALYLVLLTLFLCTTAVILYVNHQESMKGTLISPVELLQIQDDLDLYEILEEKMIVEAVETINKSNWEQEIFIEEFRERFFEQYKEQKDMKEFIIRGAILDEKTFVEEIARKDWESFLTRRLYPETGTYFEGGVMYFTRGSIGKHLLLNSAGLQDINFPVEVLYYFEQTYAIAHDEKGYKVAAVGG